MSKHTPGPWQVLPEECDKPYIRVRGTALGCRYKIANVVTPTYEGVRPEEAQETRANARLIAAAPDLLEALKLASAWVEEYISQMRAYNISKQANDDLSVIYAAIKAVEGEIK